MTQNHAVRVHPSADRLARTDQLAWAIAEVAADPVEVPDDVVDMIINRVIDNAAVTVASLTRTPPSTARAQALAHPYAGPRNGATVSGVDPATRVSPEWAAWANGVAVRELDYHDTFLAADYSHPGDNIPPIVAVAQHTGRRRGRAGPRASPPATRSRSTWSGRSACTRTRSTTSPTWARRSPPAWHAARPVARGDLPRGRPGAAHDDGHAAVAQGRDLVVEGLRPGVRGQGRHRGRGPGDARRDVADPDLRGRGRRHRLDARRSRRRLRRAAARSRRGQAGDPRHVHQGALGGVPVAGAHRPGAQPAPRAPGPDQPAQRGVDRHPHVAPHALRDRLRRQRPAEVRPDGVARDARPLDPVHLHGRAAGRRLGPRRVLRTRPRRPARTRSSCGRRSPPPRTPRGPSGTTRATRRRRRSAAASRSRPPAARSSSRSSPWPTPTRWAPGRSPGSSTSRSSARSRPGCSRRTRSSGSSTSPSGCPSLTADELAGLTVVAPAGLLDTVSTPEGLF